MTGIFSPHPNPTLRVLSLGLGVQSTTLLEMACEGEITPAPDFALFADTQAEPRGVYEHLTRLQRRNSIPFPIKVIGKGNLRQSVEQSINSTGGRFASVPFFVKDEAGSIGAGRRQCTKEFKLEPIWKAIRQELGVEPKRRVPKGTVVEVWIGITTDEIIRVSPDRHAWAHNRFPLIEKHMSRGDCMEWLKRREIAVPVKSRCVFCPFTSNEEWRRIKADDPEQWADACDVDRKIRDGGKSRGLRGQQFVHRSGMPLDEADLRVPDPRQGTMGELCGGVSCGT